jgi:TrpR-related protein YerC/YecD
MWNCIAVGTIVLISVLIVIKGGKSMEYRSKFQDELVDQLFKAILSLETMGECYRFFEDICTVNEIKSLAQRLEVARMLREKKTYNEIAEKTKASTATISRVNRFLLYGADGYNIVLDKLSKE